MTSIEVQRLESAAVATFLLAATEDTAGLAIEGEPGIGKTTLWQHAVDEARRNGFRLLDARAGSAEVTLTYAVLADLLDDVEPAMLTALPTVQRMAIDAVSLRGPTAGTPVDERVLGAAFRGVVELLAESSPVLVAIDDVQWLDISTRAALAFAVRRLRGPVGWLTTLRAEADGRHTSRRLEMHAGETVQRISLEPLSFSGLHELIAMRLGRVFPRPTMTRIHDISGGNPLYALELARVMAKPDGADGPLPATLTALVRNRIAGLDIGVRKVLLAAASLTSATVPMVAQACGTSVDEAMESLEDAEAGGVIVIDGNRIRFTHPLLATGVYLEASGTKRRAMHRTLSGIVTSQELTARHLALATTSGDAATLAALDAAAELTSANGAPAAAADLIDLAISVGGDTPSRRLRAADLHFRAGSLDRAKELVESVIDTAPRGTLRAVALMLQSAVYGYGESFVKAVGALTQAVDEAKNPALRLQGLMMLAPAIGLTGHLAESVEYASRAVELADELGVPALRSQALSLWTHMRFMFGLGVDQGLLQTALDLEDADTAAHVTLTASAVDALIASWLGELEVARAKMDALRRRCLDRGNEVDLIWVAENSTMVDLWLGRYAAAGVTADDAMQRAEQVGGRFMRIIALTCRAAVAAYTGRVDDARLAAGEAIDAAHLSGGVLVGAAPRMSLGFLEVSLGRYAEALTVLAPLLDTFDAERDTEIFVGGYLPDAIEAMVAVGQVDGAEILVEALEGNGARLDRPWMLAVGGRGRAMVLAARGDAAGAERVARVALAAHDRLPMPFEWARTQFLLGQLQYRRRQRGAVDTLGAALDVFDRLGSPLWAQRARMELERANVHGQRAAELTATERRVAQLAAAGMGNRDIAAAMFVSAKTIEAHLGRVYRKLGIRSRAELARHLDDPSGGGS